MKKSTSATARQLIQSLTNLKPKDGANRPKHRRRPSYMRTDGRRMMSLNLHIEETTMDILNEWCKELGCHRADLMRAAIELFGERFNLKSPTGLWNVETPRTKIAASAKST